jgi:uncharacterized protein YkwD
MHRSRFTFVPALAALICACSSVGVASAHAPRHGVSAGARTASIEGCVGADETPNSENLASVRAATLCLINRERAAHGERALVTNAHLEAAAQGHSNNMVADDYFEHVGPNGQTPVSRIRAAGYLQNPRAGYAIGENIAWGTLWLATPRAIVSAWMNSPGHRANILNPRYRETGIGISPSAPSSMSEGQSGATYTQDFGVIIGG